MANEKNNTFHLAITMAGAISAGAYTAGVMDYLLETLDKWEKMKADERYKKLLPDHNIRIEILSGASAGGMTACISSLVLFEKERVHVDFETNEGEREKNRLYNAWVNLPYKRRKLSGFRAAEVLLGDDDVLEIEEFKQSSKGDAGNVRFPISVLNSSIVRKIADKTVQLSESEKLDFSLDNRAPFVAENFDIFVTLTNLRGFKSRIPLRSSDPNYVAQYVSTDHRDLVMFNIGVEKEGSVTVDFLGESDRARESVTLLKNAAVSTGAFPIGLEYGFIERKPQLINDNILLKRLHSPAPGEFIVNPDLTKYSAAMIDGGLIDNEPFELTDFLLKHRLGDDCQKNCTLLMIDPFPSQAIEPESQSIFIDQMHKNYPYSFWGAAAQLIMTARSQLVVKKNQKSHKDLELLKNAVDDEDTSCFLISPRRKTPDGRIIDGSNAIACGTLGGFGGFIHEDFRRHDFFLGRANCKSFLQKHFKFEAELLDDPRSPFFKSYSEDSQQPFRIVDKDKKVFYPIIPDVDLLLKCQEIENPDYEDERKKNLDAVYARNSFPRLSRGEFDSFYDSVKPLMKKRIKLILGTIVPRWLMFVLSPLNSFLIWFGLRQLKNKIIVRDLEKKEIIR